MINKKRYWAISLVLLIIVWASAIYLVSVINPEPIKENRVSKDLRDIDSMVKRNSKYIDSLNVLIKQLRDGRRKD